MSVIGIDFGNSTCFIAVARAGGIETIANEFSQRDTPSYVAFGDKTRDLGVSAKTKQVTNLKNTIFGFKKLIGRKLQDPVVKHESTFLPYTLIELPNGEVGVKVRYLQEETTFSINQITAMLFTKLKEITEAALKIKVSDCVISVPYYYTDCERRAILDASQIAGLNCLKLMNETTAVALSYGFYKNDLPEEKPRYVGFVDMGHSSLSVAIVAFNKDKLRIVSCAFEPVGGRDLDMVLVRNFVQEFKERYKLDVPSNKRAVIRLIQECDKLKKQMSANQLELPINIECFMEDKDVMGKMKRETFEGLCSEYFDRVEKAFVRALKDGNLKPSDIESVEIVGGSTRMPAIKNLVKKVFGKDPSTTLNQDEAVARGCALQCAMLSPIFKVREFSIVDVQPYPIFLKYQAGKGEEGEMEVFPLYHQIPFSKMLTFFRAEPFTLEAYYGENAAVPYPTRHIGSFHIKNVRKTDGESAKVKVKVRINLHGVFSVMSATMLEKVQDLSVNKDTEKSPNSSAPPNGEILPPDEAMQTEGQPKGEEVQDSKGDAKETSNADVDMESKGEKTEKIEETKDGKDGKESSNKKKLVNSIDLPIEAKVHQLNTAQLNDLTEKEAKMVYQDKMEKERVDSKNAVEEYVYEIRDHLSGKLEKFISEKDSQAFRKLLNDTEDWLYAEGEELQKSAYVEKLNQLKKFGQPVVNRQRESEERPKALEEMGRSLQLVDKALTQQKNGDEQYSHIPQDEIAKLTKALAEKRSWLDKNIGLLNKLPSTQDPPITVAKIRQEKQEFEVLSNSILTRPKPPPAPEGGSSESKSESDETTGGTDKMDVD